MTGPLVAAATERLARAGVPSPRVDAELLLAALLDLPRSRLALTGAPSAAVTTTYAEHVARRIAREPLQHIIGRAPFRYIEVEVGPGVFVPRPETELLVDAVLPGLRAAALPTAVDLCSGSGAVALALADEVPGIRVVAVEYAAGALGWLSRNTEGTSVQVQAGDVRDPQLLRSMHGQVDAVTCNPPYVPQATDVEPEVSADPGDAVFAGADGLDLVPSVISRAASLLRPGGVLAVEHDDSHEHTAPELLEADGRWTSVAGHRDLAGRPRFVTAARR